MKKIGLVLIFALAISFANAQDKTTTTTTTKTTTTKAKSTPATRTPVTVADLPKAIQDDLAKTWAGYTAKNAYKVDRESVITYKVLVAKDTIQMALNYDAAGKFVSSRAISQKASTARNLQQKETPKLQSTETKKDSTK
jgi:hypothetical protein